MTKKAENEEVKITVISNDKEETLEEIQEKIKSSEYLNSITTMSSTMSKLSKSIIESYQPILNNINRINGFYSGLEETIKKISEMQKTIMPDIINNAIESSNKLSNNLSKIINSYNFDNLMNIAVSSKLQTTLQELTKVIKTFHVGDLSGYETEYLKNNFWVLPYDIEYKDINSLTSLSNEEFNAKMLEHFTNDRINNLVDICIKNEDKKDKKILLKQVQDNIEMGNYSICNVALINYLDGLTLNLIDESSPKKHTSHFVIDALHKYYETHDSYLMFLKVEVLLNFYNSIYESDDLKNPTKNDVNRNTTSHGAKFSNEKIDTLRLLNAIWYIQEFIKETDFKDKFILTNSNAKEKKDKYTLKNRDDT